MEAVAAARARVEAVNPRVNAVVRRLDAHAEARLGEELAGPFAGVPFLLQPYPQFTGGLNVFDAKPSPQDDNETDTNFIYESVQMGFNGPAWFARLAASFQ